MRRIRIIEQISLDGVIQSPGGRTEDGDYPSGGWAMPFFDAAVGEAVATAQGEALDLLLGRRTYDIWSAYWPKVTDDAMAGRFNRARKYVATHRPESLGWGPVEALGGDLAAAIRGVKATPGPDLIVWGSSSLMPALIAPGLADEIVLLTYPVMLGAGKRILPAGAAARELAHVRSTATASGVLVSTYRPAGALRTADAPPPG